MGYPGFDDRSAPGGRSDPMQCLRVAQAATPSWEGHKAPMSATTSSHSRPLLLVGIPRSGTTWTMQVLGADPNLDPLRSPTTKARRRRRSGARRPREGFRPCNRVTTTSATTGSGHGYLKAHPGAFGCAWRPRYSGPYRPPGRTRFLQGRRVPLMTIAGAIASHPGSTPSELRDQRLLVKSVHAPLALEWLAEEFEIDVLVLLRHPGNVLSSWLALNLNEPIHPPGREPSGAYPTPQPLGRRSPRPRPSRAHDFLDRRLEHGARGSCVP